MCSEQTNQKLKQSISIAARKRHTTNRYNKFDVHSELYKCYKKRIIIWFNYKICCYKFNKIFFFFIKYNVMTVLFFIFIFTYSSLIKYWNGILQHKCKRFNKYCM